MDYKQKYQEALEKVKGLLKDQEMALHAREKLANVFPELTESEDEMIRKEIHIYLDWLDGRKDYAPKGDYTIRDMIAWLEKQGEKKINHTDIKEIAHQIAWETSKNYDPSLSKEAWCEMAALDMASWLKREVDDAYLQGICDAKNEIERQGKQKQTWEPNAAQLIVIKDLIEDKSTSKVNKIILRGMLDEFKQFTDTRKMEIEKHGENKQEPVQKPFDYEHATIHQKDFAPKDEPNFNIEIPFGAIDSELQEVSYDIPEGFNAEIKDDRVIIKKVEPTFKVGDWIVNTNSRLIWQITCIRNSLYYIRDVNGNEGYETYDGLRDNYHLWSINDAKDEHETMLREIQVVNAKDDKKDEKIRKGIIRNLQYLMERSEEGFVKEDLQERIAWLEKQDKHQQLYIRFGDIPLNEISKIYRGEEEIGSENGVSVYPAFEFINGNIVLGLSLPITKTTLDTQLCLLEYENRPCYLVKGDYIGNDSDGQPLINNITIIKKIDNYRIKHDKKD